MSVRIVIIGGVAGGMSAATRARRMNEEASIVVLEKGGFISYASCGLPYYLAGRITEEEKLLITSPQKVKDRFRIDARVGHEVTKIDRAEKQVNVIERATGNQYTLPYDKLILATGATPIVPPMEHVRAPNVFLLRTVEDSRAAHRWVEKHQPQAAVVVGAGFIGLEVAEAIRERGLRVTVVEKADHALPPLDSEMATTVAEELGKHGVELITGCSLKALRAVDGVVSAVEVEDRRVVPADMVVLAIGVRPNVALAADAELTIGASGGIAVDTFQRTSDPDVYAVGDAAEVLHGVTGLSVRVPLAGPANRQGRLAGEHAATGSSPRAGKALGTAIVQVFDLSVGMTGLGESAARKAGFDVDTAYALPSHHATYYPDAKPLRIKLIYDATTGRVLGAQMVGAAGIDKRLDVIATAIHFGATVDDLAEVDLAYAPQFGSAKDPVHIVAMVAQNQREGVMPAVAANELTSEDTLVDVRTAEEFATGSLPGAVNIPLDELRQRYSELNPNKAVVTFCKVGQRGYIAQRILRQQRFKNVRNLKGGLTMAVAAGPSEQLMTSGAIEAPSAHHHNVQPVTSSRTKN
jgi:NADPH-dependent 2,4-dienoyl-CoA reductase/sulfur reductase-like enzyme/rhodanese-related sulfurtransferase